MRVGLFEYYCVFVVIVCSGSLMVVVDQFVINQFIISCQFVVLEWELGLMLFQCFSCLLSLSDVGCMLLFYVEILCVVVDVVVQVLCVFGQVFSGWLWVICFIVVVCCVLLFVLLVWVSCYLQFKLDLLVGDVLLFVVELGIDVVVCMGELVDFNFVQMWLGVLCLVVFGVMCCLVWYGWFYLLVEFVQYVCVLVLVMVFFWKLQVNGYEEIVVVCVNLILLFVDLLCDVVQQGFGFVLLLIWFWSEDELVVVGVEWLLLGWLMFECLLLVLMVMWFGFCSKVVVFIVFVCEVWQCYELV